MLKYNFLLIISFLFVLASCTKNKEDYYIKDIQSNERAIIDLKIANQIGSAVITRTADASTAVFKVFGKAEDLKSLKPNFALSYGATVVPASGSAADFTTSPDNSINYSVTSQSGQTRVWKVQVQLFVNPYEGSWKITKFHFNWDDKFGWGNNGDAEVTAKLTAAAPGNDDLITFGPLMAGTDGSIYGTYERTNGADAAAPSYISSKGKDWSGKLGQLPTGKGKYYINVDNTISVLLDGASTKLNSIGASATTSTTMEYDLNTAPFTSSTIDWSDYYGISDNKFCVATRIWYVLSKQ